MDLKWSANSPSFSAHSLESSGDFRKPFGSSAFPVAFLVASISSWTFCFQRLTNACLLDTLSLSKEFQNQDVASAAPAPVVCMATALGLNWCASLSSAGIFERSSIAA